MSTTYPAQCLNLARENNTVAREGNSHLVLPSYATATTKLPQHSGRVAAMEHHHALRRIMPNIHPNIAIHHRDSHLHLAHQCRIFAVMHRQDAQRTYGDAGEPNRTPISGGICDHWPEEIKDLVVAYDRLHQAHRDLALSWHRYAGKRRETFLSLILSAI